MRPLRSHHLSALLLAAMVAQFTPVAQSVAQAPRTLTNTDIMRLASVGGVDLSPDGERVVYTVTQWEHPGAKGDTALGDRHERRSHIWQVPFKGGAARQLTNGESGESQPRWSPDGQSIGFLAARGAGTGDDAPRPQVWLLPANGGEATQLTSARDGVSAFSWSPDGRRIAYVTTDSLARADEAKTRRRDDAKVYEADFRLGQLWTMTVDGSDARKVTNGAFTVRGAPSWSPAGTHLAFDASPTPMIRDERRDAYVVELASGRLDRISSASDVETTPQFSPDGRTLVYTTVAHEWKPQADGIMPRTLRNAHLITFDLSSRSHTDHSLKSFDVSPGQPRWAADGSAIFFTGADRVWQSLFRYDLSARTYKKLTSESLVSGVSTNRDDSRTAFVIETTERPGEVHAQSGSDAAPIKITDTNSWLSEYGLGRSEVITWKSKDGAQVEGVLLYPVGYRAGSRVPLVVSAHGGPTSAHTNGFKAGSGPGQTWASRGWAVLYPNPRGSTGYGESWMRANIRDWGGGDYRDIMTGVDEVIKRGIVDSTRMAFEGWSYGGYMTSWVVSQTRRFKAAMMGAGLPSLLSMAGTTDIPGYISTFFNGIPQYDGSLVNPNIKFYLERSAISYADNISTPLLILHGANDERVPIGQPIEFYRALKDRGKTVELVFYPREGHGLGEYYHQLDRMEREYAWMAKYALLNAVLQ